MLSVARRFSDDWIINFLVLLPFIYVSSTILFFTYDNLLLFILIYIYFLILEERITIRNSVVITIILGFVHSAFGLFFFCYFAFHNFYKGKIISFTLFVIGITLIISTIIFGFNLITFKELMISFKQSSEMSNALILERPKQLLLLFLIIFSYSILRIKTKFLNQILINKYKAFEVFIFVFTLLICLTIYKKYIEILFLFQIIYFTFYANNQIGSNSRIYRIFDLTFFSIVLIAFISGNSLSKIGIVALPAITLGLIINLNSFKFKHKIYIFILIIYTLFQSLFLPYRDGNIFTPREEIMTRFGNIFVDTNKADIFYEIQKDLKQYDFNEITILGSAPWIYLISDIKPVTKNLFFDIKHNLFFDYLSNLETNNLLIIETSEKIEEYKLNLKCDDKIFQTNIMKINKMLHRKYTNKYFICSKYE